MPAMAVVIKRRAGSRMAMTVAMSVIVIVGVVSVRHGRILRQRHAHNRADHDCGKEHAQHDDHHHRRPANARRRENGLIDHGGVAFVRRRGGVGMRGRDRGGVWISAKSAS
jgi:hypothetical protein